MRPWILRLAVVASLAWPAPASATPDIFAVDVNSFYTVDANTGAATLVGGTGFTGLRGLDFHPTTGVLYAIAFHPVTFLPVLITIDPVTGAGTQVAGTSALVKDLSFRPSDGVLFATKLGTLATITLAGAQTDLGLTGAFGGQALGFSPAGGLYVGFYGDLRLLNQATGASLGTIVGTGDVHPSACGARFEAMAFDPASGDLYAALRLNESTGGGTGGACPNGPFDDLAIVDFPPSLGQVTVTRIGALGIAAKGLAIPEPHGATLLAAGALGLVALGRRRARG